MQLLASFDSTVAVTFHMLAGTYVSTGVLLGDLIAASLSSGDFGHFFFQSEENQDFRLEKSNQDCSQRSVISSFGSMMQREIKFNSC